MYRVFVRRQRVAGLALAFSLSAPVSTLADGRRSNETTVTAVAARPADAVPASSTSGELSAEAILDAMNDYRDRYRLPPLRFDRRLNTAAQDRMRDMFEQGYFDHIAPDGTSPFTVIRRRGYRYFSAAENLAVGRLSARGVVDGWMRSPGHRANILGDFEDTGIAIASGSPIYRTRGYTFVALYGHRR